MKVYKQIDIYTLFYMLHIMHILTSTLDSKVSASLVIKFFCIFASVARLLYCSNFSAFLLKGGVEVEGIQQTGNCGVAVHVS